MKNQLGLPLLAAASILGGFAALAAGRLSIGPLLLVAGYCVILPVYLWFSFQGRVGE